VLPKYLLHLFGYEAKRGHFGSASRGVNIHHLGSQTLAAWPVAIPPLEEQKLIIEAIEEQFSRLDAGVESLQRAKRNLDGLRASILEAAFEGLPTAPLSTRLREPLRNGKSAKKAVNGAVRVFTLTAVTESDFSERNTKIVDLEPADLDDLWAAPGDLFVERSNTPDLVGTTALFSGPSSWAIFPDLLIRVRLDETTEPRFAELAIGAPRLRRYFRSRAKGIAGSMPKIDQETVASAPLPAIPLDRQLHIVSEVDRQLSILDATARALDGGLRRASGLRQSILHDAFAGRLIDRVGGRARTTMEGGNAGG
jgi:type I restriction enzyme S subunit